MTRPLTARMAEALGEKRRPVGLLAEIEHPDGTARFWTGVGTLSYDGFAWTGAGKLGGVSPIKKSSELSIQEIAFTLVGVDSDIAAQLSDNVRNRAGRVWLACFGDKGEVIADPYLLIDAVLDYQSLHVADDGATSITINAIDGFTTLERGIDEAWTPESQRLDYPTDVGLDMIPTLQNQQILWTPA